MLRRMACVELLVAVAGCTDRVPLYDGIDAAPLTADAISQHDDGSTWQDPSCSEIRKPAGFYPQWQEIIIVLDRSSSMQAGFSGSSSRQVAVQSALYDAIGAVQNRVRFGLELFPGDSNGGNGGCYHNTCCAGELAVPPMAYAQSSIGTYLLCSEQTGCDAEASDSPAHKALEQVQKFISYRSHWPDPSLQSSSVLLITAVEPSCGSEAGNSEACPAKTFGAQLANYDVPIVILTVGYDPRSSPTSCLVQLSKAGNPGPDRLNTPSSYSALKDTLSSLFKSAARKSCTFTTYDIIPDFATLTVSLGSTPIAKDGPDGWSYDGPDKSRIKLSDKACDQFVNSQTRTLTVSYPCSTCDGPNACPQEHS